MAALQKRDEEELEDKHPIGSTPVPPPSDCSFTDQVIRTEASGVGSGVSSGFGKISQAVVDAVNEADWREAKGMMYMDEGRETAQIFIEPLSGPPITIQVKMTQNVAELRDMVAKTLNIPFNHVQLLCQGKPMDDFATLWDLNVGIESTSHDLASQRRRQLYFHWETIKSVRGKKG